MRGFSGAFLQMKRAGKDFGPDPGRTRRLVVLERNAVKLVVGSADCTLR